MEHKDIYKFKNINKRTLKSVKPKNITDIKKSLNTTERTKVPIGDIICCMLIVALCLIIGLPRYLQNFNLGDDGVLAYSSLQVLHGKVPNRDFVSLQPPLPFYTLAVVFKILGTSLASIRTFGLSIYVIVTLLVYAISRHITGRILSLWATIPAAIMGMPYYNFSPCQVWQGMLMTLIAVLCFIHAITHKNRYWAFIAGLATAGAILSRHDQGFYLSLSILIYAALIKYAMRDSVPIRIGQKLLAWMAGTAIIMLPLLIYWLICGAASYMYKQLIVFLLTRYAETSSRPMPGFNMELPLRDNVIVAMYYVAPIICLIAAIWLITAIIHKRFSIKHATIGFMLTLSVFFYCQVLTRSDMPHMLITLPPFFILCLWCIENLSTAIGNGINKRYKFFSSSAIRLVVLLIFGIMTVSFLFYMKPLFIKNAKGYRLTLASNRCGLFVAPAYAYYWNHIINIIQMHSKPDDSILCLPYVPMFYFLSDRHNPTQWNYLWPGDQTNEDHITFVEQAKNDPPAIIITTEGPLGTLESPAIKKYIKSEYKEVYKADIMTFYVPLKTNSK